MLGICSLFIPASTPRMINAGLCFNSSSFIFDLEDAVSIEEKDSARDMLAYALPLYKDKTVAIRINCKEGCWKEDIKLVKDSNINIVVVPKAEEDFIKEVSNVLDQYKSNAYIAALIETAVAIEMLPKIACASKRVKSMLLGAEDYCLDMGIERTAIGTEILYARNRLCNIAHSYGLEALDTPYANIVDIETLKLDAQFAKSLGFTGKLAINPIQISTIQEVFMPSDAEIEWAYLVNEAANDPQNKGKGAFSLEGKMIDLPIIKRAQNILMRIEKQGGVI